MTAITPLATAGQSVPVTARPTIYITSLSQLPPTAVPVGSTLGTPLGAHHGLGLHHSPRLHHAPKHGLLERVAVASLAGAAIGAAIGAVSPVTVVSGALVGAGVGAGLVLMRAALGKHAHERATPVCPPPVTVPPPATTTVVPPATTVTT